jgi:hypothetical protein
MKLVGDLWANTENMNKALSYVESRAKANWDFAHSRGLLYRLYRFVFRVRPLVVIWIEQYEWDRDNWGCRVIRCWRYDANGLTRVDEIGEIDISSAIASATPVISFCVDPEDQRMVYSESHGRRAGGEWVLKLQEDGNWTSERMPWVS